MKTVSRLIALSCLFFSTTAAHSQASSKPIPIPLKPDPPLSIDGDLSDWKSVPGNLTFDSAKQTVFGGNWKGAKDLSATVQLSWRQEAIFVAATVTDDVLSQTQRGSSLWKGDHIELYLDTAPETDPANSAFGSRQFQISISPGNFQRTGDTLADLAPEAYIFQPQGVFAQGAQVAAQRTADGYIIEASLPWSLFNFTPQVGLPMGIEVGISDTDGSEAGQGKLMTIGTDTWDWSRARLQPAVMANADGSAPASITKTPLPVKADIQPGASQTFTFDAPTIPQGYEAILALKARLETPTAGGYTWAMNATLNGKTLDLKRLANKSSSEMMATGHMINTAAGNDFYVPYAPDFEAADNSQYYALQGVKAALFEFRIGDLLKPTGNTLVIKNAVSDGITHALVVGDAHLLYRIPEAPKVWQGPPTGTLPVVAPRTLKPINYTIKENPDQSFVLNFGDNTFKVSSQYSTPDGKWVNNSNKFFSIKRQIEKKGEWVVVRDTFTNLTDANLPLMHRDQVAMKPEKIWLSGLSPSSIVGMTSDPKNPTVFALQGKMGIGLLPLDDVYQVHINSYSTPDYIGLADNTLVLKPKSTYTAEWAIVPVPSTNNFDFINATRRLLDTNFRVDGSFAFVRADPNNTLKWSDQKIIDFAKYKDAKYWCLDTITYPHYKGRPPQGTALQQVDHTFWRDAISRWRKLLPNTTQIAYFHCFLDVTDEAPEKYKDSRHLLADGTQGDYGNRNLNLFTPTLTNSYGPAIAKSISLFTEDLKMDGIYWDEMDQSRYAYDYNLDQWDGVSADIDPKTMQITRLKSSVALLSQPWRLQQAKNIMKRGTLIANGGLPSTRTMRELKYPAFNETGSISHCVWSQLYSPIALGDHITEQNAEDAYRTMLKALNYGCVYYWYNDLNVIPKHFTLTHYMFPITPIELHEGYIIGKERIITNRSGVFGWNDKSQHEVHLFDNTGREVNLKDIKSPTSIKSYEKDGKRWTELRIGEDWSAAIVKKP